jgi:phosphorylase kinase alpha/beta subunit
MITRSVQILKDLQRPSGLFLASPCNGTGYNKAWIRDCIYEAMGLEAVNNYKEVVKTFHALLDILAKHEYKIDCAIRVKPEHSYQYIHARYHPETFDEFWEEWGNRQNDAVGALLFKIFDLESRGIKVIRGEQDLQILQKLVHYLESIEYWHDEDNGMWEENAEIHASSVGACVAGLKKASIMLDVPQELIKKGEETLNWLLPRESETKIADLALLSLIYPYNVVSEEQKQAILKNVEEMLVRNKGVIRYENDQYYNKDGEAEWTFGFPWLAKIYKEMNLPHKYAFYMRKTLEAMNEKGELPELYYAGSDEHNENSPLGWSQAMFLVMVGE